MEISIEASLNRDCRNTRRANICLHGCCEAGIFRARVHLRGQLGYVSIGHACACRAMYVSVAYRLSTCPVDRINRQWNRYIRRLSTTTTIFNQQKVFFIRQVRSVLPWLVYARISACNVWIIRFNIVDICRITLMQI